MLARLQELRARAAEVLTEEAFDYYECGAGEEVASQEAEGAWLDFRLLPRVLRNVAQVDTGVRLLGVRWPNPVAVAPTAFHAVAHPGAEVATVQGAGRAGCLTVVSTRSSRLLEDVALAATGPWWFQVYLLRDRALTEALVRRAVAAGAGALVLTGDTPYVGRKARLAGVRFPMPAEEFAVNLRPHLRPGADLEHEAEQDPSAGLDAVRWLAEISGLPVLVKGVLRGDDALDCLAAGAAGVVVSNHGGRQSPRALATAHALTGVVAAVAGRAPVLVDGGIRSGTDALVALALGATAVLLGRPVLWGLAAGGAAGVHSALEAVVEDLAHGLALLGASDLASLDPSHVARVR